MNDQSKSINHSCQPNTGIRGKNDLYALEDIKAGDEITFDYSTTVGRNNDWNMICHCGNLRCRKIIRNFLSIPKQQFDYYSKLKVLPDFIKAQLKEEESHLSEIYHHIQQSYIKSANLLKLPVKYPDNVSVVMISLANHNYYFLGGLTPFNNVSSGRIASNKYLTNKFLREIGFPVPEAILISKNNKVNGGWKIPSLTYPIVAKPCLGGCGENVLCNIQNETTLIHYLDENFKKYTEISLEKFEANLTTYRVLVFFNKVIGVARLDPASIVGDGKHTIRELIEIENQKRAQFVPVLQDIKIDQECNARLQASNLTLDDIPKSHEKVLLSYTCNTERGGTDTSLGNEICPENAALLVNAAKALNLNMAGFDIICEDIRRPIKKSRGFILEANFNPDITYHELPSIGKPIPISKIFLRHLIKKHPIAYIKMRFKKIWKEYSFWIRALLIVSCFMGVIKYLKVLCS